MKHLLSLIQNNSTLLYLERYIEIEKLAKIIFLDSEPYMYST